MRDDKYHPDKLKEFLLWARENGFAVHRADISGHVFEGVDVTAMQGHQHPPAVEQEITTDDYPDSTEGRFAREFGIGPPPMGIKDDDDG